MMPPINVTTAMVAALGFFVVLRGYLPLMKTHLDPFGYYIMRGAIGVATVMALRLGWWDLARYVGHDYWEIARVALGGQRISAVFNVMMLWPIYDFLKARWYLIPRADRHHWRWWNAGFHPSKKCIAARITRRRESE